MYYWYKNCYILLDIRLLLNLLFLFSQLRREILLRDSSQSYLFFVYYLFYFSTILQHWSIFNSTTISLSWFQSCVSRIFYLSFEQSRIFCWKNCTVYNLESVSVSIFLIANIELYSRVEQVIATLVIEVSEKYIFVFNYQKTAQQVRSEDFIRYFASSWRYWQKEIETSTIRNWNIRDLFEKIVIPIYKSWKNNKLDLYKKINI